MTNGHQKAGNQRKPYNKPSKLKQVRDETPMKIQRTAKISPRNTNQRFVGS